jgi:hypothetical protein
VSGPACPCTAPAFVVLEWECRRGHKGYASLCSDHGAVHVAALLSGDIRCGTCRERDKRETAVRLLRVNGRRVGR